MRRTTWWRTALLLGVALTGCKSGGGGGPTCSFNDPASWTQSPWPKFRHDAPNTGAVVNPNVKSTVQCGWVFPPGGGKSSCPSGTPGVAKGAFQASPVVAVGNTGADSFIYIGSNDGTLYKVRVTDGTPDTAFSLSLPEAIKSTAVVARRDGDDAVFVGGGDGAIHGVTSTGQAQPTNWPNAPGGVFDASPTLGDDGTVYAASLDGFFWGVCPNGVERFVVSTASVQSSPAQGAGLVYFGAEDRLLRAVRPNPGRSEWTFAWTFSAAGPILAAPVFDPDTDAIYVADTAGYVFKVGTDGKPGSGPGAFAFPLPPEQCARRCFEGVNAERPCAADSDCPGSSCSNDCGIRSSPAVAGDHLYFGSNDGYLYAINKCTGHTDWKLHTGGEIVSSPAVAISAQPQPTTCPLPASPVVQPRIVVVGSNDGNVYFVEDKVDASGNFVGNVGTFPIGAAVRSSPAVGSDGTVYVGADDGRLYAITPQ